MAGVYASLFAGGGILGQLFGGMLSDRIGKKKVMLLSTSVCVVLALIFVYSQGLLIPISILFFGLFLTLSQPVGLLHAAEISAAEKVGKNVGVVFGISIVFQSFTAVYMGFMIDQMGFFIPYLTLSAVAFVSFICFYKMPEAPKNK